MNINLYSYVHIFVHVFAIQTSSMHEYAYEYMLFACSVLCCCFFFFKNNNFYSIRFVSFRLNSIEFLIATTVMARPAIVCLHVLKSFVFFLFLLWLLPSLLLGCLPMLMVAVVDSFMFYINTQKITTTTIAKYE